MPFEAILELFTLILHFWYKFLCIQVLCNIYIYYNTNKHTFEDLKDPYSAMQNPWPRSIQNLSSIGAHMHKILKYKFSSPKNSQICGTSCPILQCALWLAAVVKLALLNRKRIMVSRKFSEKKKVKKLTSPRDLDCCFLLH